MANNSIGGFFVSLGLKTDKNSFSQGEASIAKFIGTASKAVAGATALAKIAGSVENNNLKLAKAIGISGSELEAWQDSARKAGVSAGALTSSMAQIENKMQKLKTGEMDEGLAKNLGLLGLDYGNFAQMDATERMRSVFGAAGQMQDQAKAAMLVGDTLGSAAREYYDWLSLSGRTLDQELAASKALSFTTDETMKSASMFNAEFNGLLNATKSIAMLIGSKIGEAITPIVRSMERMLAINKEFIVSGIIGVVDVFKKLGAVFGDIAMKVTGADSVSAAIEKIAKGVGKFAGTAITTAIDLLKSLVDVLADLLNLDFDKLGEDFKKLGNTWETGINGIFNGGKTQTEAIVTAAAAPKTTVPEIVGAAVHQTAAVASNLPKALEFSTQVQGLQKDIAKVYRDKYQWWNPFVEKGKVYLEDLPPELQSRMQEYYAAGGTDEFLGSEVYGGKKSIHDGIVAPGGNVTQVAPDDWVIAARNLGDVAAAFMPQEMTQNTNNNSNASYVINQSFTFQGGRDMASEVMRQAYSGTQSGLLAAMNRGTERLQLMPGLR